MPEPGRSPRCARPARPAARRGSSSSHRRGAATPGRGRPAAPPGRCRAGRPRRRTTRSLAVAVVRQHRDVRRARRGVADAAVVGAEVVAPVGDAVGLVDHEQARPSAVRRGRTPSRNAGVVQPLGRHHQQVDGARGDAVVDLVPVVDVGRVDGLGGDARPPGGRDLVAHEREQRRDDQRGAGPLLAEQAGGDEVHGRLAPPGALDDEGAAPVEHERLDGRELVGSDDGVGARERPDELTRPFGERSAAVGSVHPAVLSSRHAPHGHPAAGAARRRRGDPPDLQRGGADLDGDLRHRAALARRAAALPRPIAAARTR